MLPLMFILTRSSPTVFNTRITEFNQNLLESSCPYIAYPTSIDLDDSNPYCRDILNLLENRNDFENSERELHNIKISEINNKTYLHLFTKVHHYDSVTYRDIFAVLKEICTDIDWKHSIQTKATLEQFRINLFKPQRLKQNCLLKQMDEHKDSILAKITKEP
ncbi:hypothetical protein K1T71_006310 [Dendrolimus kikuchii]|uniref:Uncharacterized protein n=1 Tax=Dendrolimus kikuchii TaxID=765133 RepID=A0ACC1D3S2_9NEOP|nr:hypothetical protein K1T71_006310 [Dendrolimus kikuchii]